MNPFFSRWAKRSGEIPVRPKKNTPQALAFRKVRRERP
jgi:hypothetical protein